MARYSNTKAGVKRWQADIWFSQCVRLAADNKCERCRGEASDCCHIYGRSKIVTRWSKDNAIALCRTCHNRFGTEPCEWTDFIDLRWPGRRDRLILKLRGYLKNTEDNRQLISTHYNKEFRRMEKDGTRDFESWN